MTKSILLIKLGAIGDVLRTTSLLQGIKEKYRDCSIDWITKGVSFDVLKNNPLINKIYLISEETENIFKDKSYDLVVSLDDDYEACKLATIIKSKKITGSYLKNNKKNYTEGSSLWFDIGIISKYGKKRADELKARNKKTYQEIMYSILELKYKKQEPILILNKAELNFGKRFGDKHKIKNTDLVIGINTGAGLRWEDKKLSVEKTAVLIDKINKEINAKIILFGGPEERTRNEEIKEKAKSRIIDSGCDNSLMEFASLINLCNVLVTSDSLALHIGVALKKKIIVFFYVTSDSEIELYNRGIKIVGKGKDYCSYKTKCDYPPKWNIDEIVSAVKTFYSTNLRLVE